MTRKQTLHHFELACGVLPDDETDVPLIAEETPAPFLGEHSLDDGLDLIPTGLDDTIAENDVPPPPSTEIPPDYPTGGSPPAYPPFTGGVTPPGNPAPPPDVPEPSSYVLMLTGLAGATGAVRGRFRS
jgi:hypothetical protein